MSATCSRKFERFAQASSRKGYGKCFTALTLRFCQTTSHSANEFENVTATFTKHPARFTTPRTPSENASQHSENAAARFGKCVSHIRKTPLKTYNHVCLVYWKLLPSFLSCFLRFWILPMWKKRKVNITLPSFLSFFLHFWILPMWKKQKSKIQNALFRKTLQPDSENALESVRTRLSRLLDSSSVASQKKIQYYKKPALGKQSNQIRKPPQPDSENAYENGTTTSV